MSSPSGPANANARRPIFATLMSFSAACFVLTLLTDLVYARSYNTAWETFSIWLLTIGLLAAVVFLVIGLIDGLVRHAWPSVVIGLGYAAALILSIFNAFIHSGDGYTAVVPVGLVLSIVVVAILLITWLIEWRTARYARNSA